MLRNSETFRTGSQGDHPRRGRYPGQGENGALNRLLSHREKRVRANTAHFSSLRREFRFLKGKTENSQKVQGIHKIVHFWQRLLQII